MGENATNLSCDEEYGDSLAWQPNDPPFPLFALRYHRDDNDRILPPLLPEMFDNIKDEEKEEEEQDHSYNGSEEEEEADGEGCVGSTGIGGKIETGWGNFGPITSVLSLHSDDDEDTNGNGIDNRYEEEAEGGEAAMSEDELENRVKRSTLRVNVELSFHLPNWLACIPPCPNEYLRCLRLVQFVLQLGFQGSIFF
jgi:hypothetical protein